MTPYQPFIVKDLFPANVFEKLKAEALTLKKQKDIYVDDKIFFRAAVANPLFFQKILYHILTPIACKLFNEDLVPTFSFLSFYIPGQGICPPHIDSDYCYRTIDLCVDQAEVWPLYVNSEEKIRKMNLGPGFIHDKRLIDEIKSGSTEYLMTPGEALCYSGTQSPHWRNKMSPNNFCDLAFFHFVLAGTKLNKIS